MATDLTAADPGPVLDLLNGFRKSQIMFTAVELGIFDALLHGPQTFQELATRLRLNVDATERLLYACVHLNLLTQSPDGRFANTPTATTYLATKSPDRFLGYINYSRTVLWKMWDHLPTAIREGTHLWKQTFGTDGPIFSHFFRTESAKREFLLGMHGFGLLSSPHVVTALDLSRFKTFVDLGGATGHLAVAACRRYPHLQSVVSDLAEVVGLTKEMVDATEVAGRVQIVPGDFFSDPLPPGDIYALGRILHDWTEEKMIRLLTKIHDALPTAGAVLIAEKVLHDDKAGPEWAVVQSLNMLVCTEGKERTLAEYAAILTRIGFRDVVCQRTASPLDVVLAIK